MLVLHRSFSLEFLLYEIRNKKGFKLENIYKKNVYILRENNYRDMNDPLQIFKWESTLFLE